MEWCEGGIAGDLAPRSVRSWSDAMGDADAKAHRQGVPEQPLPIDRLKVVLRADVWSLGVTAYVLAFGRMPPWAEVALADMPQELPRYDPVPLDHPDPEVNDLLSNLLAHDPEKRATLQE
eukprot:gene39598-15719_t